MRRSMSALPSQAFRPPSCWIPLAVELPFLLVGASAPPGDWFLSGPSSRCISEPWCSAHCGSGSPAASALAHVASLAATAALPYQRRRTQESNVARQPGWRSIASPTLVGTVGWFVMTALMGATPIALIGCAPSEAVVGAVAWHVMAMYAPSLALALFPQAARPLPLSISGCLLLATGAVAFMISGTAGWFSVSAALIGTGWSLTMLSTTLAIHRYGPVSRWLLGAHDGALLTGAILGALAANIFT